jgi:hypothetical protein
MIIFKVVVKLVKYCRIMVIFEWVERMNMQYKNIPKTIPDLFREINKASHIDIITTLENYLVCYIAGPLILIGSILNFYFRYVQRHFEIRYVMIDSLFLFFIAITFILLPYAIL